MPLVAQSGAGGTLVFIGTYASPASKGIYVSRLDPSTGALSTPTLAAEVRNPSFLAASADGRFLYAVSEVDAVGGKPGGAVAGYAIDKAAGTLKPLNTQSTVGGGPCHVSVAGRMVFAANYGGGSIAAYQTQDDGSLKPASTFVQHKGSSVNPDRQKGPHAHGVTPDPSGRFLYVPDLGLDQVLVYRIDAAAGTIAPATPPFTAVTPAGSGPRHIALSRDGRHAYVINEMVCTIGVFDRNAGDRRAVAGPDDQHAAGGAGGREGLQHRGGAAAPVRQVPLRLEPRPRQPRRLRGGRVERQAHAGAARADRRQDAARLQHRSERHVPRRRQPGQRSDRRSSASIRRKARSPRPASTISVGKPVSFEFVR